MLIKKEILKNLCPFYVKEIEKLEQEYAEIPECDHGIKKDCLLKFSQNYLMLKELWDIFFDESRKEQAEASFTPNISQLVQAYLNNKERSRYHFYIPNGNDGYKKLWHRTPHLNTNFLLDYSEIRLQLNLPQKGLEHTLKFFDEHSCKPLPKEAYRLYTKAKELYSKILIADNKSDEEWFNLIIEVKDIEFVANNIEWRIGNNNLNCQKLWKLYLKYLEKNDTKRLLYLYSCYCRFFISDSEAKNEYKRFVEKYGPSVVHWKNLFKFEIKGEMEIFSNNSMSPVCSVYRSKFDNITKISFANCCPQNFAFSKTIMFYIIENANPASLHKLHKCCKYFFAAFSYPVYHRLQLCDNSNPNFNNDTPINYAEFFQQSASIYIAWYQPANFDFAHKFIISHSLRFGISASDTLTKAVISYIFRCTAKYIQISCQHFTYNDLKILIGYGNNVEKLCLYDTKIINDKHEDIELQEILKFTPKLVDFQIRNPKISQQTFEELNKINFKNKFKLFELSDLQSCETNAMAEFLKKNLDLNSKFNIYFIKNIDQNIVNNIYNVLKKELTGYWLVSEEPNVEIVQIPGIRQSLFDSKS